MSIEILAMMFLAGMLVAILIGLPVAIALGSVGLIGLFYMGGIQAFVILSGGTAMYQLSHFGLLAIPLFMLLSAIIKASGIGTTIVDLVINWLHRIPGVLHSAAVMSCAIFAAMSSSSVATATAVGGLILPEMKKRGHNLRLGIGSVAIGGTLGIMIPPSNYFILYGVLTETSITKLFMAGIVPGLMIVSVMILFNTILFRFWPGLSPVEDTKEAPTWSEKWRSFRRAWTGLVLIIAVVGGIFLGVVTPTEAGGLGAVIALLIGLLVLKTISKNDFVNILVEAVQTTSMIGFIIFGGLLLARASTMMNLSAWLVGVITQSGLSPWEVMLLINLLLLALGMFMDASAITMLTIPLLFPVIVELGFDPIWFGVIVALNMELALVTPPVGLNIFVLKAVAGVSLREAVLGTLPYAALLFACLGLLMLFPEIALWLPGFIE